MSPQDIVHPISPATLGRLFEFSYNVTRQNVDGFDHEASLRRPRDAGNPLNWVVGHIVATRNRMFEHLAADPLWTAEEIKTYDRGSQPAAPDWKPLPFERILADLDRTQQVLRSKLPGLTAGTLASPLPPDRNPFGLDSVGEMLAAYSFHESYHAGQTGILRRILGRDAAIN